MKDFPGLFGVKVSHTTRKPRPGEINGKSFYFVNEDEFANMIKLKKFMEWSKVHGHLYGTAKVELARVFKLRRIAILEVDVRGAQALIDKSFRGNFLFICPPSLDALKDRIVKRGIDSNEDMQMRLAAAESEINFANTAGIYEHKIVNGDLKTSYENLKALIQELYKEEIKRLRETKKPKTSTNNHTI